MGEFCFRLPILALVTHLIFVEFVCGVSSCPAPEPPCECERKSGRLVLICRQQNLDRVPKFNHSDELIDELTLAANRLVALPNDAFRGLRVRRLDLKDNRLVLVSPTAFSGLERHLEELRIELNPAAEFPSKALAPLTLLRVLDVIGYGSASLPSGALASFSLLLELRLTAGSLQTISPADVTATQTSLSVVDLSGNPLGGVPTAALATLSNLTEVVLSGCGIARFGARAFATNWIGLQRIDLSQNRLQVWIIMTAVVI